MPKKARSSAMAATSERQGREGERNKDVEVNADKDVDADANADVMADSGGAAGKANRV